MFFIFNTPVNLYSAGQLDLAPETALAILSARLSAKWLLTTKIACMTPGIQKNKVRRMFRTN